MDEFICQAYVTVDSVVLVVVRKDNSLQYIYFRYAAVYFISFRHNYGTR